jgi:hypothetical protein
MKGDLPGRTLLWRIVQDHERKDLFFLATEFGICFTIDGGKKWIQMKGGLPVISFRDLAIQRRENDLVCASFGRSFYILDDYSPLRTVTEEQLKQEATLFPVKDAWWYPQRMQLGGEPKGSQGAGLFAAPNPPYGAVFTYYLKETYKSRKELRQEEEKKLIKENAAVTFPGWDEVEAERRQEKARIVITVMDKSGNIIRRLSGPAEKGFHRIAWDFKASAIYAISLGSEFPPKEDRPGMLVPPGTYSVSISKEIDGVITPLSGPESFEVKQLRESSLKGSSQEDIAAFRKELEEMQQAVEALAITMEDAGKRVNAMRLALSRTSMAPGELDSGLYSLKQELFDLDEQLYGNRSQQQVGESSPPTVASRMNYAAYGIAGSLYGPTGTQKQSLELARKAYKEIRDKVIALTETRIPAMEKVLVEAGAPWIEGQPLPE